MIKNLRSEFVPDWDTRGKSFLVEGKNKKNWD